MLQLLAGPEPVAVLDASQGLAQVQVVQSRLAAD